ncbi:MAG: HAMP domain-containing protein [Nitrospinaceae bacterium]|nr:MAG: HAMP domain-containing protein [Nitrospinaceae bacterium]
MNSPKEPENSPSTPRIGLKNKLIRTMIVVGTLPLLLAMVISYVQGNKSVQEVIGASFQALAFETATKTDFILREEIAKNSHRASHPTLILAARGQNQRLTGVDDADLEEHLAAALASWKPGGEPTHPILQNAGSRVLKSFLKAGGPSAEATRAMYVTDARGILVSSINFHPAILGADDPAQKKVMAEGEGFVYLSDIHQAHGKGEYVFHLAVPIMNFEKKIFGIFHRIYSAKKFFSPSIEPIIFGETGHVMMINSDGIVIDCPILPTGTRLPNPELIKSVTGPEANWAQTRGDGHGSEDLSIIGYAPLLETNTILNASSGKKWFTFAWQASQELFAPTRKLFQWISAAALISILLIVFMGSLASDRIVQPIRRLQNTTARIGRGEEVEPLEIRTGDEIESLAEEVNTMNRLLSEAFLGLEDEVRKKTKALIYLQEYTESILMSVPDVLLIFNENLTLQYVNQAFEKLTGAAGKDVEGKSLQGLTQEFTEQWAFLAKELTRFSSGTSSIGPGAPAASGEPRDPLAPKVSDEEGDQRNTINLGSHVYVYQFFHVNVKADDKNPIGLLMRDISEEKALQDQLTMAEKLSGLGTLAAGIAHEMNNPLYSIMGYTEAILDEKDTGKIQTFAEKILSRARHMASVILNMSGYTRSKATDTTQDVNLNERLDAAIEMALMASYSDNIELVKNYSPLPLIQAKPEELQQIFLNIIRNGVQAMEGKGKITISSSRLDGNIVTQISDTGPGIPREYLSKIFDPFFTTKEQGKGTGLGLNIVHRLVGKYGGQIKVDSQLNSGTTFTITFPIPPTH